MAKRAILTFYWNSIAEPVLGFPITWSSDLSTAENSVDDYSGFFNPNTTVDGYRNIHIFSELPLIVATDFAGSVDINRTVQSRALDINLSNTAVEGVVAIEILNSLDVSSSSMKSTSLSGLNFNSGATFKLNNLGYSTEQMDDIITTLPNKAIVVESLGNDLISPEVQVQFEADGGSITQDTEQSVLRLYTKADSSTNFTMQTFNSALSDWYLEGILTFTDDNNVTFAFTGTDTKKVEVRLDNLTDGKEINLTNKDLVGTLNLSHMVNMEGQINLGINPELTEVLLPESDGEFVSVSAFATGIVDLELDKIPGCINNDNVIISLSSCANLNTDAVARRILSVDTATNTGREIDFSGSTPTLDLGLHADLLANGWVVN